MKSKRAKAGQGYGKTNVRRDENDWVYGCERGLSTAIITRALNVTGQPVTEVSASGWRHEWQMANSFMEAYAFPPAYRFRPGQHVSWDGFKDWMLPKLWREERTPRGRLLHAQFVGETVIVRHSWEAAEDVLAMLLDVMRAHVNDARARLPKTARIVAILEGWETETVTARVRGHQVGWAVNPLPSLPEP